MASLKFFILSLFFLMAPFQIFAQNRNLEIVNDDVAYASIFVGDFSLLLSIVIGIIATFFVFKSARKMGGGLFGVVLNYIAIGMIFVVLGTISIFMQHSFSSIWYNVINTFCFASGYIFMVIGANRLLKGIINN